MARIAREEHPTVAIFVGFVVAPWFAGAGYFAAFSTLCLLIYLAAIQAQLKVMMKVKPWTALVFPLSFVILPLIFMRASLTTLRRGGVNWRGTFYSLSGLKTGQRMKLANLVFAAEPATVTALETTETLDGQQREPALGRTS